MKITLLHYSTPPVVGGVESVLEHHANLMTSQGHQVQVIAGRGSQFNKKVSFHVIPLIDSRHAEILEVKKELDAGNVSKKFNKLVSDIEYTLKSFLLDTDVLIAHNVCSLNKNLPLTAALFNVSKQNQKLKLILWHHDLAWATPRYQNELHEGYPWDLLKTAWINAVQVTISDSRRDELSELMKIDKSQIQVIPNGVDLEKFFKLDAQTFDHVKKLDLLKANPLLLLPVRITSRKNIELALQIIFAFKKYFPNVKIVVTGPLGPHNPANVEYFEKLKTLREELNIKDSVHFLAELTNQFIPDSVISDFYKLADALLFPSIEEGFGIPMLEAGFSNIPIFCSDIPPLKKLGGDFANYFSLTEPPNIIAKRMGDYFSNNKIFLMKSEMRESFTWGNIYQTKIEPLLKV